MYSLFKMTLLQSLIFTALYSGTIVQKTWVPLNMGEIQTFIPYVLYLSDKDDDGIPDAVDRPIAYSQDVTIDLDSGRYDITLSGWDNDSSITYEIVTRPQHGRLEGTFPDLTYVPDVGYEGTDSFTFQVSDGDHTSNVVSVNIAVSVAYGAVGSHDVSTYTEKEFGESIVYYPTDIGAMPRTPLIFFLPGFGSQDHNDYRSLLRFIASHGYSVIYAKDYYADTATFIRWFEKILDDTNNVLPYVDTTRIGVIGHSSGGGDTFKILDYFSKKGYGENGRFLMGLDPWFAFDMNSDMMRHLPANTNLIIQRYEHPEHHNTQDPRITLSEYALLDSIAENKKDYQVFTPATHGYPTGAQPYSAMQGLLEPLGALMAYTFENEEQAHDKALENGSDTPYEDGLEIMNEIKTYAYRCNSHKNSAEVMEIDYCHQYLGGKIYPPDTVFDYLRNVKPEQPAYLESYVDPVFHNRVTRITDRENQTANAHPYPKTQAWNADMSLIRLGYRLYYADNFTETLLTQNQLLRGSLTEMKWSTIDPNVFYGIDVRWDRFVFMKATIDQENNTIQYDVMPNATFMKSEYDELKLGKYEGNLDYQDNYVVFAGRKKDTNRVTLMVYHLHDNYGTTFNKLESNETTQMKWYVEDENGNFTTATTQANQMFDWASISALGNYVIVNYRSKKGDDEQEYSIEQYDRNIRHIRRLAEHGNHGDLGVDTNGKEVYVQFGFDTINGEDNRRIWMYPLDGSPRVQLLPDKYNGNHLTCRNYQRPGWCYVNTRYLNTDDPDTGTGVREVFAVKLDGSGTVERFAQTHSSAQNTGCVQVNVSPDGTQLLFASDWNLGSEEDYQWDAENYMSCTNNDRKVKIDTYHVKVGE